MSASIITIPYIMAINGIIGGMFWILAGAVMTFYASRLLVECSEVTRKSSYENFANVAFGKRWKIIVAVSQIITMLSFFVTYLTLLKTMVPKVFEDMFDGPQNLPYWMQKNQTG